MTTTDSSQHSIRRAQPSDTEAVASLTDAAYTKWVPLLRRKPQPMTANYRDIIATHPVWLLSAADTIAGLLVLIYEPDTLLIESVAIHPAYQHRGFGRRLLSLAEDEARRAGYASLRLYTNALMEANIALYRRLGYEETRREPYKGSALVHLAKQLADVG
ncbi:MAG: GNAT family N-acetyltransferase [Chloroflexales bacterium]|nr:GNAT family N-acetyltransferase [Chloroflexales bacterium]